MEIKFDFRLQTILKWVHLLERLDLETIALLLVGLLLTPFFIYSLWSLAIAVVCQLFWLGVKAGVLMFGVCGAYMAFLRATKLTSPGSPGPKCTMSDVVLSVLFQTGLSIPAGIWDRAMSVIVGGDDGEEVKRARDRRQNNLRNRAPRLGRMAIAAERDTVDAPEDLTPPPPPPVVEDVYIPADEFSSEDEPILPVRMEEALWGAGDFEREPTPEAKIIQELVLPLASIPASTVPDVNEYGAAADEDTIPTPGPGTRRRNRGGAGTKKGSRSRRQQQH